MNTDIQNNQVAVELSDAELDTVAGGLSITGVNSFDSDAFSTFAKKTVLNEQATLAGPGGAGTSNKTGIETIISGSGQVVSIG